MPQVKCKTIGQEWGDFCKMVFGPNKPGDAQYHAMRQAFYGGAMVMFINMTKAPDVGTEDEACAIMDGYLHEISDHVAESLKDLPPEKLAEALDKLAAKLRGQDGN